MRKRIIVALTLLVVILFATIVAMASSLSLATLSVGLPSDMEPRFVATGLVNPSCTEFSGLGYSFKFNPVNQTFYGKVLTTNQGWYHFYGTYTEVNGTIYGDWSADHGWKGWLRIEVN